MNDALVIRAMIGHTTLPGNMVALTGADSRKTADVISQAFRDLPPRAAMGLTVLYVGVPGAAGDAQKAVSAAGATLKIKPMRG